jgi:hypothetical protein
MRALAPPVDFYINSKSSSSKRDNTEHLDLDSTGRVDYSDIDKDEINVKERKEVIYNPKRQRVQGRYNLRISSRV